MKEYISIGKNVDIAIEDGIRVLGLNREDVDIKILETGGLFKKAKVCLMYEEKQPEVTETATEIIEQVKEEPIQLVQEEKIEESKSVETETTIEDKTINEVESVKDNVPDEDVVKIEPTVKEIKTPDMLIDRVKSFLINLAGNMNIDIDVDYVINDNDINFDIKGENVGKLIGFRGETLNAIQTLIGGLKQAGEGKYRLYIDIENYKKAREQSLVDLANKMADKAEEIERNVHLDPMSAYERRIIHSALQGRELVETESMGEGEKRHVVIKFKR